MVSDLLYEIGEAILTEIEAVKDLTYPQGNEKPEECYITINNGRHFVVTVKEI